MSPRYPGLCTPICNVRCHNWSLQSPDVRPALLLHTELPASAGETPLSLVRVMMIVTSLLADWPLRGRRRLGEAPGICHGLVMLHVSAVTRLRQVLTLSNFKFYNSITSCIMNNEVNIFKRAKGLLKYFLKLTEKNRTLLRLISATHCHCSIPLPRTWYWQRICQLCKVKVQNCWASSWWRSAASTLSQVYQVR